MLNFTRLLIVLLFLPTLAQAEIIDRVVAQVNDDPITLSDLNNEGALHFEKIRKMAPPAEVDQALASAKKEILDSLIERKLIAQRAAKRGITVSNEEIEMQYFQIMEQNNLSEKQFIAELSKAGITPELYKKNLHSQIIRQRLLGIEIRSKVVITNEQIEEYYNTKFGRQNQDDGLHILQIGSTWGGKGKATNAEEAKGRAQQLRGMVTAGENFQEIAKAYSDLPSAENGGDIGIFKRDELSAAMQKGLADLHPGDISMIIESGQSFQFFKILSSKSGNVITQAPLESVREEIRDLLKKQLLDKKFKKWLTLLRETSYIKEQL